MTGTLAAIANHLWQSTLFAGAAGLLTLALRGHRAELRFGLWLAASLKFLLPFSLLTSLGAALASAGPAVPVAGVPPVLVATLAPVAPSGPTHWLLILAVAGWLAGTLLLAGRWAMDWRRMRAIVNAAEPARLEGLPRGVQARWTGEPVAPCLVGIRRPVLLLPHGIAQRLTPAQFNALVEHELGHRRRRDNLWAAAHRLVETLFWFHPLVWWIGARLIDERERACDETVLRAGHRPADYAEGLLVVCEAQVVRRLQGASRALGADLQQRIGHIMRRGTMKNLHLTKKAVLVAAVCGALALPVASGYLGGGATAHADDGDSSALMPVRQPAPVYPAEAIEAGLEGRVELRFTISEQGHTRDVRIVESSDPIFEGPARDAVAGFLYEPPTESGRPVAREDVPFVITFVLRREQDEAS